MATSFLPSTRGAGGDAVGAFATAPRAAGLRGQTAPSLAAPGPSVEHEASLYQPSAVAHATSSAKSRDSATHTAALSTVRGAGMRGVRALDAGYHPRAERCASLEIPAAVEQLVRVREATLEVVTLDCEFFNLVLNLGLRGFLFQFAFFSPSPLRWSYLWLERGQR